MGSLVICPGPGQGGFRREEQNVSCCRAEEGEREQGLRVRDGTGGQAACVGGTARRELSLRVLEHFMEMTEKTIEPRGNGLRVWNRSGYRLTACSYE